MNDKLNIEILKPEGVSEPQGLYNHAIAVSCGKLLFIAGPVAIDENNRFVGPGEFE